MLNSRFFSNYASAKALPIIYTGHLNLPHDILLAVARKDPQSFDLLYEAFANQVYNTALSYLQNIEDAEEVTQDVFMKVYQHAENFKGDASISTWIYRITVNTSLNQLKKQRRSSFFNFNKSEIDPPDFEHPGIILEKKEDAKLLFKALQKLPENQKTAFILGYIEDLPRQEIGDIMQISLSAVESLLQRAKKNLKNILEKIDFQRRNF